jgi:pantoate--beta-alanine ligase
MGPERKGEVGNGADHGWGAAMTLVVVDTKTALRKALDTERAAGHTIGLVPTMGALHRGHTSLMAWAKAQCDVAVATLFVNPLQFAPLEDLATYPRDPGGDQAKADQAGVAYLFAPAQAEMFPEPPITTVHVGHLAEVLEGARRPGHFAGVATIVTKLLSLAGPCRAYFGEKDYQQLAVIRRLVSDLSLPAEIVACPTVREDDGLALSSRNAYLTAAERAIAPTLHQALLAGRAAAALLATAAADDVREAMAATIAQHPEITLEYAEVVDAGDLTPLTTIDHDKPVRLLLAARIGRTRLIDNIALHETPR